ncbi:MAG: type II toxin-antitoxin system RelE/ParE family toxin [Frankiales bacterium]|nr:type II toxin-antitoxin system RelE/ParE family toxin [Frankiales bacterium]
MTSYVLSLAPSAQRQLTRLPDKVIPAVVDLLTAALLENPLRLSKALTGEFEGLRSARRGDYRVLFYLDDDAVVVVRIAHRALAYRPPSP